MGQKESYCRINDIEFGNIVADKLALMVLRYDDITDHLTIVTLHMKEQSIEEVRLIIENVFSIPEDITERFKDHKKLNLVRGLMIKGAMHYAI